MNFVVSLLIVISISARTIDAGECCRAYSTFLTSESAKYCSDYCCGNSAIKLECCSTRSSQAPSRDRESVCADWFSSSENVWAPILIGLGFIASIVGCCVCCYQCCCKNKNNKTTVIMQPTGPVGATNVIAMNTTHSQHMGPGHYPPPAPGQYPPGPAAYPPGPAAYPPTAAPKTPTAAPNPLVK